MIQTEEAPQLTASGFACQDKRHVEGTGGCVPELAAEFVLWAPCCGPRALLCAGRRAHQLATGVVHCGLCGRDWPSTKWQWVPL